MFRRLPVNQKLSQRARLRIDTPNASGGRCIDANIAEGSCRRGDRELGRVLQIAVGSAIEVEHHCLLACDLGLLEPQDYSQWNAETVEVKRMLAALISKRRADR
jgi:four helix bundle protein